MSNDNAQDPMAGGEEIKAEAVGFNKVGDYIKGTYVGKKFTKKNERGVDVYLYEIKAEVGQYHKLTEPDDAGNRMIIDIPHVLTKGEHYQVWGGKQDIDDLFNRVTPGTIVGIQFKESVKSKTPGNKPFKKMLTKAYGADMSFDGAGKGDVQEDGTPF